MVMASGTPLNTTLNTTVKPVMVQLLDIWATTCRPTSYTETVYMNQRTVLLGA
jgi:hypothetical protein